MRLFDRTEIVLDGFPVVLRYGKGSSENVRNFIYIFIKSILKKMFSGENPILKRSGLEILSHFSRGEL